MGQGMAAGTGAEAGSGGSALKTRPRELEDWLNRSLFHPLSRRLALALQHTPVSPNMVSVVSGLSIVAAAACYTLLQWPVAVAAGLLFHLLWHVFDGADGDLARLTGKTSPLGEVVDGIADYAGHGILYVSMALFLGEWWAWPLCTAAAFSRTAQAAHIESVRRTYQWRAYGVSWLGRRRALEGDGIPPGLGGVARFYLAISAAVIPRGDRADALIEKREGDPAAAAHGRALAQRIGQRALAYQAWLGPNRRTLLLGLSMAAGSPLSFMLIEIVLLNSVLLASVARQRSVNSALAAALELAPMTSASRKG